MKKFTITKRLVFLSSILMTTIGFLLYWSYDALNKSQFSYNQIIDKNFYKQELAQELFIYTKEARINALLTATEGVNDEIKLKSIEKIDETIGEISALMSSFESLKMDQSEKELFNKVKEDWGGYVLVLEKIKKYHSDKSQDKSALYAIVHNECPKMASKLKGSFEDLIMFLGSNTLKQKNVIQEFSQKETQFIFIVGIASLVLGFIISAFIIRSTNKLLTSIVDKVSDVTGKLKNESEKLSSSSQQLASAAQQQASSTEEISSSLEEISGMIGSTIKQATDSVKLSSDITKLVHQGNEAVENLDKSVNEIAEANKKVEKLVYLIEEIGQKTEIIDEIVFQTRLLSFNASVEAERAGEHGRGFAVVAQEVGNLAQMSGKSANEISEIVKKSIREAQEVVSLNKSKVMQGVDSSKQASDKLKAIYSITNDISEAVNEVLRASEEQNSGIKQINNSIQLISHSTQENATMAEEFLYGSKNLTEQSKKLNFSVENLIEFVFGNKKPVQQTETQNVQDNRVLSFPEKKNIDSKKSLESSKIAVGQNFHNEEDDHWDKL